MTTCPTCLGRGIVAEIKVCANKNCRKAFILQDQDQNPSKRFRSKGVKYCSRKCAKAQGERDRRKRIKMQKNPGGQ